MLRMFYNEISRIPTPSAGLALGIASLGSILESILSVGGAAQVISAVLASVFLLGVFCKFLFHPHLIKEELIHPVLGSILPTFTMALMVISKAVGLYSQCLWQTIWFIAVIGHLFLLAVFVRHNIRHFKIEHVLPSWFIPTVGIIAAALTSPGGIFSGLATTAMFLGLVNFAVALPIVIYRMLFLPRPADNAKPTIAVMAAPASLSLAGYLSIERDPSILLCGILLCFAIVLTGAVYVIIPRLLMRLSPNPGFAGFTFPLVISATALYKTYDVFSVNPAIMQYVEKLRWIAAIELIIAVIIVSYVFFVYIKSCIAVYRKKEYPNHN